MENRSRAYQQGAIEGYLRGRGHYGVTLENVEEDLEMDNIHVERFLEELVERGEAHRDDNRYVWVESVTEGEEEESEETEE